MIRLLCTAALFAAIGLAVTLGVSAAEPASDPQSGPSPVVHGKADITESAGAAQWVRDTETTTEPVVTEQKSVRTGPAEPPAGRRVPELTNQFGDTYLQADGSLVSHLSPTPVNYRDSQGEWQTIDDSFVADGAGARVAADRYDLRVPRALGDGPVVLSGQGASLAFQLEGAAGSAGATKGAGDTFSDVLPGTSVAFDATPRGLSEALVLADASAPESFSYRLTIGGDLTPAQLADGALAFRDADGTSTFRIASAYMYDTAGATQQVPMTIARDGAGWRLTLAPDRQWVLAHLADGPVTIDPEWDFDDNGDDCRMDQNSPTTSFCGSTNLEVGWNGTKDHSSLLRFDLGTVMPKDAIVSYAELGMYLYSHSTSTTKQVGAYRATQPWTSAATWSKYDATHSWTTAGGDFSSTFGAVTAGIGAANGWTTWTTTQIVQQWADGTQSNNGFLVKDAQSSVNNDLNFRSGSYSDPAFRPYLNVLWRLRAGDRPSYTFVRQQLNERTDLGVNVANGNLLLHSQDLHVGGTAGDDLSVDRYYNSLLQSIGYVGTQGAGATVAPGLDRWIRGLDDGSVELFMGDGSAFPFTWDGTHYQTPPGLNAKLTESAGTYKVVFDKSGEQWLFNDGIDTEVNQIKDRYGNTIVNDHRSGGSVSGWTDTQGRAVTVDTDAGGHRYITHFADSTSRDWTYAFDAGFTHLTTYTDPDGNDTTYGYDGSGRMTSITLPSGNVTKIAYDSTSGRVASIMRTTDAGHTTGPTTSFTYGSGSPCAAGETKTVVSDPDANGSNGHTVTYCSDSRDRVTKTVDSNGNAHSASFTANDDAATATPASGSADSYGYDAANNLISLQQGGSGGPTTTWGYADTNNPFQPTKQTDSQGNYQHGTYAGASSPSGPQGSLLQVDTTAQAGESGQTPNVQATFTHNSDGTVATSTDANGNVTTYGYDADGNLTSITPPSGSGLGVESVTPDALSRPHVITAHVTSTLTRSATITYDLLDRVTQVDYANSNGTGAFSVTYGYDDDGNRTSRVDPQGTTSFTFDKLNRMTDENPPGTIDHGYGYDAAGNMTSFTDGSGTTTYGYDGLNELTSMLEPGDVTATAFTYDTNHRLTRTTYPGGVTLNRAYDANTNQLTTITNRQPPAGTGTIMSQYTFSYAHGGGKSDLIQSTAASDGTNTNTSAYTYDALDRLTGAVTTGPTLNQYFAYTMDANGNRTRQVVNLSGSTSTGATTTSYGYNSGNQLCWKLTGTSSNACGSPPTGATTYTFNQAGDETGGSTGGLSFSYDNAGQTTSFTPAGGSATSLAYLDGSQDQLITNGSTSVANSQLGVSSTTTSGSTTYYGRTPDGTLVDERKPSGRSWYVFGNDVVGSVSGVVSSTGTSNGTWGYTPYGEANGGSGSDPNPFKFAAGYTLPGGYTHFGARHYDPALGRWTQQDPLRQLGDLGQADRYVYAGDRPVSAADLTGRSLLGDIVEVGVTTLGVGLTAASCATAVTGVGAVVCVGGAAVSSASVGYTLNDLTGG